MFIAFFYLLYFDNFNLAVEVKEDPISSHPQAVAVCVIDKGFYSGTIGHGYKTVNCISNSLIVLAVEFSKLAQGL